MDIVLYIISGILLFVGFIGCFLPVLPGTSISYLGIIILLHLSSNIEFSMNFLIFWAVAVVVVQILDYFIPIWGTIWWEQSRNYG